MKGERELSPKDPLRQTFVEFISTIDPSTVKQSVNDVVTFPLSEEFESNIPLFLEEYLDLPQLEEHKPPWLDQQAFIFEVFKANSVAFWDKISHHAEKEDPGISKRLLFEIHQTQGADPHRYDYDLSRTIAKQNLRFYGLATIYLGLGSVYGQDLINATRFANNEKGFQDRIDRILSAAKDIAATFSAPPDDPTELIQRMHEVFSPDTHSRRNGYSSLLIHHAFGEKVKGKAKHNCLGVELTKNIFRSYAEILTTPYYQHHFIQAVTQ